MAATAQNSQSERRPDLSDHLGGAAKDVCRREAEDRPTADDKPILPSQIVHEDVSFTVHIAVEFDENASIGPGQVHLPDEPVAGVPDDVLKDRRGQSRLVDQPAEDRFHRRTGERVGNRQHRSAASRAATSGTTTQLAHEVVWRAPLRNQLIRDGEQRRGLEHSGEISPGALRGGDRETVPSGDVGLDVRRAMDAAIVPIPDGGSGEHGEMHSLVGPLQRNLQIPQPCGAGVAEHRAFRRAEQHRGHASRGIAGQRSGQEGVPRETDDVPVAQVPGGQAHFVGGGRRRWTSQTGTDSAGRHRGTVADKALGALTSSTGPSEVCDDAAFRP
jgi:hypothetical protein